MKMWILSTIAVLVGVACGAGSAVLDYAHTGSDFVRITTGELPQGSASDDASAPHASLYVEGDVEFDFGVMDRGEKRRHVFPIVNKGNAPLTLRVGDTTCKCAVGELSSDTVEPGQTAEVELEWTAKSYEIEFRQSANIHTNDPMYPTLVLSVAGRVRQLVRAVPASIALSDVPTRASRTAQITVYGYADDDLRVVAHDWEFEDTADFLDFRWEPAAAEVLSAEPDAKAALTGMITLKPGLPVGQLRQMLRITTSSSRSSLVEVPVSARIVTDITVMGSGYADDRQLLRIGPVHRREGANRTLRITVKGPYREDFQLSVGSIEPVGAIEVSISEPQAFNSGVVLLYLVDVVIPPETPRVNCLGGEGRPYGRITLRTTHPEAPELPIDVSFAVMD